MGQVSEKSNAQAPKQLTTSGDGGAASEELAESPRMKEMAEAMAFIGASETASAVENYMANLNGVEADAKVAELQTLSEMQAAELQAFMEQHDNAKELLQSAIEAESIALRGVERKA